MVSESHYLSAQQRDSTDGDSIRVYVQKYQQALFPFHICDPDYWQGGGGSPPNNGGGGSESWICSWYGEDGEIPDNWPAGCGNPFNPNQMATAHRTLPCGTRIRVTANNRFVDVVMNDRGPHVPGRILDLTKAAFKVVETDTGRG
ncbi:unnamed protein product [Allacma fusca]|uniref:RlpA-like protein double-psi beta-barrel domain-containing protein n=1 Tax=Allacma fusca TaxID=39272 RepID=A0A8J2K7J2_9HEXA|nr:unnamed protein product [Allacma fusca]